MHADIYLQRIQSLVERGEAIDSRKQRLQARNSTGDGWLDGFAGDSRPEPVFCLAYDQTELGKWKSDIKIFCSAVIPADHSFLTELKGLDTSIDEVSLRNGLNLLRSLAENIHLGYITVASTPKGMTVDQNSALLIPKDKIRDFILRAVVELGDGENRQFGNVISKIIEIAEKENVLRRIPGLAQSLPGSDHIMINDMLHDFGRHGLLRPGLGKPGSSATNFPFYRVTEFAKSIYEGKSKYPGDGDMPNASDATEKRTYSATDIFMVHGHNQITIKAVAAFVKSLSLNPIILHMQPNGGKTIIEKFERESKNVGFAVVLLCADDLGKGKGESENRNRARQNVIFELGYFAGALGRERGSARW